MDFNRDRAAKSGHRLGKGFLSRASRWVSEGCYVIRELNQGELEVSQIKENVLVQTWHELLRQEALQRLRLCASNERPSPWSLTVAIILIAAAFAFAVHVMQQFELGWVVWPFCLGLAVALPYS